MQKSESIGELAKALAIAQGEIQNAKRDSENPFFKSKYADLAAVREACQAPLAKNGLAVIQTPTTTITEDVTIVQIETLLAHTSGEWVSDILSAIPAKPDAQGIGSCITYLRRYALSAFIGIAPEDDDGNAASRPHGNYKPQAKSRQPSKKAVSANRAILTQSVVDACKVLNQLGDTPEWTKRRANEFVALHFQGAAGVDELTDEQVSDLLRMLSERADTLKNPDRVKAELIKQIRVNLVADEAKYLKGIGHPPTLEECDIATLQSIREDVEIPF